MMLDLVQEEQRVSELTNLEFDQLLASLDLFDTGSLPDRYAEVCDGYMVLSCNGHRSHEQNLLLDRLDSSLRILFKDRGLFVQAGRLLSIGRIAVASGEVFRGSQADERELQLVREGMTRCGALSEDGLAGPIPVDGQAIAVHAQNARELAESLFRLQAETSGIGTCLTRGRGAQLGMDRLLKQLAFRSTGVDAFESLNGLFSKRFSAREKISFLYACYRIAGWSSCVAMVVAVNERLEDLAGLVHEGLGA